MNGFDLFLGAYINAMLWSTSGTNQDGEDLESLEGVDLAPITLEKAKADCTTFLKENYSLFLETPDHYDWEQFGHDFWLTRNGHGAGFWDRGLGNLGDRLTTAAQTFGQCDPYIGDDGLIYF